MCRRAIFPVSMAGQAGPFQLGHRQAHSWGFPNIIILWVKLTVKLETHAAQHNVVHDDHPVSCTRLTGCAAAVQWHTCCPASGFLYQHQKFRGRSRHGCNITVPAGPHTRAPTHTLARRPCRAQQACTQLACTGSLCTVQLQQLRSAKQCLALQPNDRHHQVKLKLPERPNRYVEQASIHPFGAAWQAASNLVGILIQAISTVYHRSSRVWIGAGRGTHWGTRLREG